MRLRRHLVALVAAAAAIAAALAVSQPTPVAAATGGSITVILDTAPADGTDVGFTGCQGTGCAPFTLDDDADGALPDRISASGLAPATYTITQDAVPGWTLTSISCTSGVSTSVAERRATIALAAGADIACTFKNQAPSITIVQDTSPDDTRDFSYTGCLGSGCGTFALDDDADPSVPTRVTSGALTPGTYTITQSPGVPWSLSGITCSTTTGITRDVPNRRVTIVLSQPTDHPVCTFTDTTQSITLVDDDLTDSGQDQAYTGCGNGGCSSFTLDDDADPALPRQVATGPIPTGTYTLTQEALPGWELTGLTCTGEATDLLARTGTITLTAGEHRICTFTNRPVPNSLNGVAEIASGAFATCARLFNGEARCWGRFTAPGSSSRPTTRPVTVPAVEGADPLSGVTDITGSYSHNCAALADGTAACWGASESGLGDGIFHEESVLRPVRVLTPDGSGPLTGVRQVSAGPLRACALLDSGQARCWGRNEYGTLGDGTTAETTLPVVVLDETGEAPLEGITQIEVGLGQTCALLVSTEVRCWGQRAYGALGDGEPVEANAPPALHPVTVRDQGGVEPLTGVVALSSGSGTCALLATGRAMCWGPGPAPVLEPGAPWNQSVPHPVLDETGVAPATDIASIAAGVNSVCVVRSAGTAWCWGHNDLGELGHGTQNNFEPLAQPVVQRSTAAPLDGVSGISVGWNTACASLDSGEARCWGQNDGNIGDGTTFTRFWAERVIAP
ncbi:MAG: hypothetical protein JNK12_00480 [Acidimicrobiales bacterium]|nr:hypothetical protein [Acidimicrobiales bacterium]